MEYLDKKVRNKVIFLKIIHFSAVLFIFYVFWLLFRYHSLIMEKQRGFRYNYYVLMGYGALLYFFNRTYNSYLLGYSRTSRLIFSQFLSELFSIVMIYVVVSLGWRRMYNPIIFLPMICFQMLLNVLWTVFGNRFYYHINPAIKTILIYRREIDKFRFGSMQEKPFKNLFRIERELRYEGNSFKDICSYLDGYEAVFVAGVQSRCRNGIEKYCKENRILGFFLPHVGDVIMKEAKHIQSFDSPVLFLTRTQLQPEYAIIKRVFDIVSSGIALFVLSPVILITALAIHLYDGGPAFYRQKRLTVDGKEFNIIKFRSMRVDAEKDGVARLSSGDDDDRITPIGRVIRKVRLDELPQLWNIFKGDMSVVGPRPERPEIAEKYYEFFPDFRLRLQVKAGLTGYAQVYGKYNTSPYEKLEFDLLYINNMSIVTDLMLIFSTIVILFLPESTEGVAVGATTAMDYENPADSTENDTETVTK